MPVYIYKGMTSAGKATKGSVTAESMASARARMRREGLFLTDISESKEDDVTRKKDEGEGSRINIEFHLRRKIPMLENAIATRQLATLVNAGIPLVEALTALVQQIEHARLRSVLANVRDKVNEGSTLADALEGTQQFDTLYVSMVRAGEAGGALGVVLERVADYMESAVSLSNKVTSIMVYPAVMLGFSALVVAVLVTFVLPQITGLLESLGQELPWYTRFIIALSDVMREYWWAILGGGAAFIAAFRSIIATERGRAAYDRAILKTPILGRITRVVAIARFSRTLGTLLNSGVGIVQALDISRHVAKNQVIGEAIVQARRSVLEGATLAAPLRASGQFPPMVLTMIEVGERGGEVDTMLMRVADTYDEQVENSITRLTSLLEPLLILLMVGIVLVIILATLLPLLDITSSMA